MQIQKMKSGSVISLVFWFIVISNILFFVYLSFNPTVYRCTEWTIVKEIVELNGRDAVIKLGNGNLKTVNQARLKVGQKYCAASEVVK